MFRRIITVIPAGRPCMSKSNANRNFITIEQGEGFAASNSATQNTPQICIDAVPHMVWSARADGHNDYHNERWLEFTGISPTMVHGHAWINLVHPEDREAVLAVWQKALEAGSDCEIEHRLLHHSGEYRWVL